MTKRLGWIGVLSLVCAGVSAGPVIEAQNRPNRGAGANANAAQTQSLARSSAPATGAPKGQVSNSGQNSGAPPRGQTYAPATLPSAATIQAHPSGVPAQSSNKTQPQTASSNQLIQANSHSVTQPAGPSAYGVVTQPSASTLMTPPQNQTPAPPANAQLSPPQGRKPSRGGTPGKPATPNTQKPNQRPQPSPNGYQHPGLARPAPLPLHPSPNGFLSPGPNTSYVSGQPQPISATNSTSNGSPGNTPAEKDTNAPPTPQNETTSQPSGQSQGRDPGNMEEILSAPTLQTTPPVATHVKSSQAVLNLTASSLRPEVEKEVVVTAELNPSQGEASYQFNWGDGSPVETVSKSATHRYAKANTYTVLARTTTIGNLQLNHEIVLQVQPVIWPRVTVVLASVAGLGLLSIPMLLHVTTGCRWDVPKVAVFGPQPHVSLSFVPSPGLSEERITFLKTKRRSG